MNLLRAASTISLFTLASRVTGLARDVVVAAAFGAGASLDAFNVAFRIPNLLRRLFGEGAFTPGVRAGPGPGPGDARATSATRRMVDAVATVLFCVLVVTCVVGVVAAPVIVWLMASGLVRFDEAVVMTADHVPVHRPDLAGLALGRRAQHLEALRRAGGDAGAAQRRHDRRRLGAGAALRALGPRRRSTPWPPA